MLLALLNLAIDLNHPRIPYHFEPNRGQVAGETEWIAKATCGKLYIKSDAVAFGLTDQAKTPRVMRFVGAKPAKGEGLDPTAGYSNYFGGRDEKSWRSGIQHFARVRYKDIYQGIDLLYYTTADHQIEYDLEIARGANVNQVELSFSGFDKVTVDEQGDLVLRTGDRAIKQHRPKVFQHGNEISASYRLLSQNRVKIDLAPYDESERLTVDPVLDFSTYLGGPGADYLAGLTLDTNGNIYVVGYTQTPANPSLNPFQQTNTIVGAAFVAKLTPNADKILFFSVLSSSGSSEGTGIGVDATGSPTLVGFTSSPTFPLKNAFQATITASLYTGFVARFSVDGRTIIYSSYYGGSGVDLMHQAVLDTNGNVVFSGTTSSHDIPIANAYQPVFGGGTFDCFLAKVNPSGALVFSTYFGGSGTDQCGMLALDSSGGVYFGGDSYSDDLPLKSAIQTVRSPRSGFPTAFVAHFTSDAKSLLYSSFLGGPGSATLNAVALNSKGEIYLGGGAYGDQFSTANAFQDTCASDVCGLLMKLDPTGQKVLASTFFAGSGRSGVSAIATGSDDSLFVAGVASSSDFPTLGNLFPFAGGGPDNQDVFAAKFSSDVRTLIYSTFIGGNSEDGLSGIAVDSANRLYLAGGTGSDNFPVKNAFQSAAGGGGDGFLLRLSDSTIQESSPLIAIPGQVQLRFVQGGPPVTTKTVQLSGASVPFTVSSNAAWVTASPQSGTAPATLAIGAAQLVPGIYSATVNVTPASGAPLAIPVTYTVLSPAPQLTSVNPAFVPLLADDTVVTFSGSGFTPQTQLILNGNVWGPPVGGSSVVFVNAQTLQTTMSYLWFVAAGSYSFSAVNPQSDTSTAVTVSVGGASPVITSIVNAASQLSGPIAPGELIILTGANFGPASLLTATIGGISATVISSSNAQALILVPVQLQGSTAQLVLGSAGLTSIPATIALAPTAVGLFTANGSGKGPAMIQGTPSPGSSITLFGTGVTDLTLLFTVTINGETAPVVSIGPVQNQPGVFQLEVTIPSDAPSLVSGHPRGPLSQPTVLVSVGGQSSQPGVTLPIVALR